jgi:ceramide glucosyltransferase
VSILKPLKGVDKALGTNLESFFQIDYPTFEILFSVGSTSDPAAQVVKKLIEKYPDVDAKLVYCETLLFHFIICWTVFEKQKNKTTKQQTKQKQNVAAGESEVGNPKINNMMVSYRMAKYPIMWQSDSNMIVRPKELTRMVHCLDTNIGLVHQVCFPPSHLLSSGLMIYGAWYPFFLLLLLWFFQLPLAANPKTLPAQMELCYISTWHATMYLFFNYCIDTHCIVGKSLVFRKANMDSLGGLESYSNYLAEDYFMSKDFWKKRWPSRISPDPSVQNLDNLTLPEYWNRQERWTRLRFSTQSGPTFLEVFCNSFVNAMLSYHAMSTLLKIPPAEYLFYHFLVWLMTDLLQVTCFYGFSPSDLAYFFLAWILRELLSTPLTLYAAMGNTVMWRGKVYRISEGSTLSDLKKDWKQFTVAVAVLISFDFLRSFLGSLFVIILRRFIIQEECEREREEKKCSFFFSSSQLSSF